MSVHTQEYDVVGIGFGPANLAIAIALQEQAELDDLQYCFLEKQPRFEWHAVCCWKALACRCLS